MGGSTEHRLMHSGMCFKPAPREPLLGGEGKLVLVSSGALVLEEATCGWHQEGGIFRSFYTVQLSVKGSNEPLYPTYGKSLP